MSPESDLMPTSTFENLSPEKKARILESAIDEFSQRRFSEASINQIIKAAEISRGSFYQYFSDKEDLYVYMLQMIGEEKMKWVFGKVALDGDDDFFATYLKMFRAGLDWAADKPKYARIGYLMRIDDSDFITRLKGLSDHLNVKLAAMLERDKQLGRVRKDVDSALVVEMILAVLSVEEVIKEYKAGSHEKMVERLEKVFAIIKGGIQVVQG